MKVNFIFHYPNMSGGTKSCRLMAEELERQGVDVVIYHPSKQREFSLKRCIKEILFSKKIKDQAPAGMAHHLEECDVRVVATPGTVVKEKYVRDADFSIANFWMQRQWIQDWAPSKGIKGLYVRAHNVNEYATEEKLAEIYRAGGIYITHAKWLYRKLKHDYGVEHAVLAPNGVDRSQFTYEARTKQKTPTIGFQYDPDPRKGAKDCIDAINLMLQKIPDMNILTYGARPKSNSHSINAAWQHFVRPSYADIARIYRSCDCWVLPSLAEGLPMPPLEAHACGTPVVATLCGGPEDYVTEGESGYLVEVGDSTLMAERLFEVLSLDDEAWKEMSFAAYKNSLSFEWSSSARSLINELESFIETKVEK